MRSLYKKFSVSMLVAAVLLPLVGIGAVKALEPATPKQIELVKSRCTELESSLNQLERSDALLRNNIGNSYLTISQKLMIPLNQRIAANQLDGGELVKLSAEYKKTYDDEFYVSYKNYEIALSKTLKIDCRSEPTELFESIAATREERMKLYEASQKIISLAKQYNVEYKKFKKDILKEAS